VLSVSGAAVMVTTPEAVAGDDLQQLESEVLLRFRQHLEEERAAHTESQRLHLAAIRQIMRLLRPESRHVAPPG
jgi:F-type H+-transporting ATPase subunit epsilon